MGDNFGLDSASGCVSIGRARPKCFPFHRQQPVEIIDGLDEPFAQLHAGLPLENVPGQAVVRTSAWPGTFSSGSPACNCAKGSSRPSIISTGCCRWNGKHLGLARPIETQPLAESRPKLSPIQHTWKSYRIASHG